MPTKTSKFTDPVWYLIAHPPCHESYLRDESLALACEVVCRYDLGEAAAVSIVWEWNLDMDGKWTFHEIQAAIRANVTGSHEYHGCPLRFQ